MACPCCCWYSFILWCLVAPIEGSTILFVCPAPLTWTTECLLTAGGGVTVQINACPDRFDHSDCSGFKCWLCAPRGPSADCRADPFSPGLLAHKLSCFLSVWKQNKAETGGDPERLRNAEHCSQSFLFHIPGLIALWASCTGLLF